MRLVPLALTVIAATFVVAPTRAGARTCSWQHKGTITYRCEGVLNKTTVINVVGAAGGRNKFAANCRGKEQTISAGSAYKGLHGVVHIHWHTGGAGQYTKGMLRVGA
ncbi:hypothetical protein NLX83_23545 [Allokutzneria sp. A3M-2-11 16]|uniref:hypothetical protein n=1 Tax=Allokutzneria sp. A3M-2-11 16 TaxID=2962043 RepID=UPI0020B6952B|nr:hypothetical protein [Allokutzneria sp. A3M-2-11 16]MCP3802248.1 hypothetical protein [Allokutzneria sp. A3M-2-11 16]